MCFIHARLFDRTVANIRSQTNQNADFSKECLTKTKIPDLTSSKTT